MQPALHSTWRPLFTEQESLPYRQAIDAIAAEIARPDPTHLQQSRLHATARHDGSAALADLAGGRAGLALFFAYRHLHTGDADDRTTAMRLLDEAIQGMAGTAFSPRFFRGWPGVAWVADHLAGLPGWLVEDRPVTEILRVVEHLTRPERWAGHLDLVSDLTGLGICTLARLPRPAAYRELRAVVGRLADHADTLGDGEHWLAPGPGLAPDAAGGDADSRNEPGLVHGIPGVIALLAEAHAAGVDQALPLLDRIVSWTLGGMPPSGTSALFPHWSDQANGNGQTPRSHWTNSASGLAAALMIAGVRVGRPVWRSLAVDLAVRAANTPLDRCLIADHSLCRGAAGMAHLYNRMHQATGDEGLREGARMWFRRLLDMRHEGSGVGGFLAYMPRRGCGDPWIPDAGLMTGAAGTALAMLSAVGPVVPGWDQMMLLSVPTLGMARHQDSPPRTCPADGTRSSIPHRPA
jgi:hypothetical protein